MQEEVATLTSEKKITKKQETIKKQKLMKINSLGSL